MKKTILVSLRKANENSPLIVVENYSSRHIIKYLLFLCSKTGQRLSVASYSNKILALCHLFRIYSVKQNEQFTMDLKTVFEDLNRQIAKEKQIGNNKIQTHKTPIPFALYCLTSMNIIERKIEWDKMY